MEPVDPYLGLWAAQDSDGPTKQAINKCARFCGPLEMAMWACMLRCRPPKKRVYEAALARLLYPQLEAAALADAHVRAAAAAPQAGGIAAAANTFDMVDVWGGLEALEASPSLQAGQCIDVSTVGRRFCLDDKPSLHHVCWACTCMDGPQIACMIMHMH